MDRETSTLARAGEGDTQRERERERERDLVESGYAAGFNTELITIEVGSRGMLPQEEIEILKSTFNMPRKAMSLLCLSIIRKTILESFKIWCSRNIVH